MAGAKVHKGYAEAPTGQIHYRMAGEGIPLLLLHQSPQSSLMYEEAYPIFARAGVLTIGLDTPGFGMSDIPETRPSIETYASAIPPLLEALKLEKVAVLGHHTGACIATEISIARPDLVSKAIFSGPPVWQESVRQGLVDRARREPSPIRADGSHLSERWQYRVSRSTGWSNLRAMHRNVLQTLLAGDTDWYGHIAAYEYPMEERFMQVAVPGLILTNTGDDLYALSRRAHKLRPEFSYVELEGGSHDIVDEQPEAWCAAVVEFLKRDA